MGRLDNLYTSMLGFDSMFRDLKSLLDSSHVSAFPPTNIYREENGYTIEMAVAGYSKDQIDITHDKKNGKLTISAQARLDEAQDRELVHCGIAKRSFTRSFTVANNVVVDSASFENGVLTLKLNVIQDKENEPLKIILK